jgi:hypothetical protein
MPTLNGRQLVRIHYYPDGVNARPIRFYSQRQPELSVDPQAQACLTVDLDEMQRRGSPVNPIHESDDKLRNPVAAHDRPWRGGNATTSIGRPGRVGREQLQH